VLWESEFTVPVLLRVDGTVGGLRHQPLYEHLLTDAHHFARIDLMGYGDDLDGIEEGNVAHVQQAMHNFVMAWNGRLERLLE
jgi:hypothetical protein